MNLSGVVQRFGPDGRLVSFRGQDAFVSTRVFTAVELPGMEMNYFRRGDDGVFPATIETHVWANRMGIIVTERPIQFDLKDRGRNEPNYLELTQLEKELFVEVLS